MTIREMHYDIKFKLNKIDSQQNRNLKIQEIDWVINEANEILIKLIAEPRVKNQFGFETSQRTIDDLRTIVKNNVVVTPTKIDAKTYIATLPEDYMFYISSKVIISRGSCDNREAKVTVRQHDDRFENSPFDESSFEWKEVNIRFYDQGIKIFTDGTFNVDSLILNYIKKQDYIHNAQDFLPTGQYRLPSGVLLTGSKDCELPEHMHRELVDLAILLISGNLANADYSLKQAKLNLNQVNN